MWTLQASGLTHASAIISWRRFTGNRRCVQWRQGAAKPAILIPRRKRDAWALAACMHSSKSHCFFCGACILPGKRSARGNSVLWPVSRPSLARFSDAYPIVLWSGCHRSTALPPSLQPDGLPLLIIQPCQLISISFCALQTLCLPTCGRRLARFQCIPAV